MRVVGKGRGCCIYVVLESTKERKGKSFDTTLHILYCKSYVLDSVYIYTGNVFISHSIFKMTHYLSDVHNLNNRVFQNIHLRSMTNTQETMPIIPASMYPNTAHHYNT